MRYLSVCSGIEAASAAWHALGWEAAGFAEIEPFPSAVLAARWPGVPNFGDFTHIEKSDVGTIDVLVGGTPCQSFSIAGLREGLRDDRGNLALEYFRLAARCGPRWLLWENVPGVLSSNGGRDFGAILGAMVECGYGFAYRVLDAQYFGVPQRRRRVFLVGYLGDWRPAAAVLFERQSLRWDFAPGRQAGQGVAGAIGSRASAGGGLETAHTLNAKGGAGRIDAESETFVTHALTSGGFDASEDGTGRGTPLVTVATLDANYGRLQGCSGQDAGHGHSHLLPVALHENQRGELTLNDTAGALNVGGGKPGQGYPAVLSSGVRRLTPRECERLQGFTDDYTLVPYPLPKWAGKWPERVKYAADGPRYRAIGNSMAVPVMRWLGERIDLVEGVLADRKPKRKRAA